MTKRTTRIHFINSIAVSMDTLTKAQRRKTMQAIKSVGTKPEIILGKAMFAKGLRYRKNDKRVFGKPDFTLGKYKIAIFVDGEFWHGKDWEQRKYDHKSNVEYWHKKIERNIVRDKEVGYELGNSGWTILRFWGKQIEKELDCCISKIEETIVTVKSRLNDPQSTDHQIK